MANNRAVSNYSTFVTQLAGLVGLPTSRVTSELFATWNASFNTSMQKMWSGSSWVEVSPYGEARFLGNRLSYPNNLANTTYWTATAVTMAANSVGNPADGNVTASSMLETAANSAHKVVQSVTSFFPNTMYNVSFYGRPNGRNYIYLSIFDGSATYTAFFNVSTGAVGTTSGFTNPPTIAQQPNGFWQCAATFTTGATTSASGTYTLQLSTDGSTLSYAGDITKGAYIWGALTQQSSNTPVSDLTLPWNQLGESAIDSMYNTWLVSPFASNYPPQLGYNITPNGIQYVNGSPCQYSYYVNGVAQNNLYGAPPNNPIYIYYRQVCPSWTGTEYSATATYTVGQQIYFTNSAGTSDYWACIVATSAGQSPDTTATSWQLIPVYATFVNYATYQTLGDWFVSDGQQDKADAMYAIAQDRLDLQFDLFERQMQGMSPMVVNTHLSSRSTW